MRSARLVEVAAMENNAPGVEVPMPKRAFARYNGGLRTPAPAPQSAAATPTTPWLVILRHWVLVLPRFEMVSMEVEAVPLT